MQLLLCLSAVAFWAHSTHLRDSVTLILSYLEDVTFLTSEEEKKLNLIILIHISAAES